MVDGRKRRIVVTTEFLVDEGDPMPVNLGDIAGLIRDVDLGTAFGRIMALKGEVLSPAATRDALTGFGQGGGADAGYIDARGGAHDLDLDDALRLVMDLAAQEPLHYYDDIAKRAMLAGQAPYIATVEGLRRMLATPGGPELRIAGQALHHEQAPSDAFEPVGPSIQHAGNALKLTLARAANRAVALEMAADGQASDVHDRHHAALDMIRDVILLNSAALDFEVGEPTPTTEPTAPTP